MKSLNTKKIVAMATGAALLGSALLGAVSYQNTELINDNGAPMAKVVVGSNAHISDGVAAANIAAVLGNMAFKSVEVTATPTGINGLSCDVSGEGAGTCSVLSKSVDLEVVTPAGVIPAGAYGFSTLINDFIDSDLKDRSSTGDDELFPPNTIGAEEPARKISAKDFSLLGDYSVVDPESAISAVELQNVYVKGDLADGVFYDADEGFMVDSVSIAYEIEFEDAGIPVCSDDDAGYWAGCKGLNGYDVDEDKQMENHRVKVKFLGEEWILSEMDITESTTVNQGYIKLAQESAYSPKLQIGEDLDLGDGNKLVLGDLKPASGAQVADIAIFSVLNAVGEEIASKTVAAGATTEIKAGANTYRVRVYQVAPGYTLTEKWAEVAVFGNELKLEDGEELENNDDWEVSLTWKDEDSNEAGLAGDVDSLSKIQLVRDAEEMYVGSSQTIVKDPAIWRFTFTGLNLNEDDYVGVDVSFTTMSSSYKIYSDCSDSDDPEDNCADVLTANHEVVKIVADDEIFVVNDVDGLIVDEEVDTLYVLPFGTNDTANYGQMVVFKYENDYFIADNTDLEYTVSDKNYDVEFYSSDTTDWLTMDWTSTYGSGIYNINGSVMVLFEEDADDTYNYFGFATAEEDGEGNSNDLVIDGDGDNLADDDDEKIKYYWDASYTAAGLPTGFALGDNMTTVEDEFYTARGSHIESVKASGVSFAIAKEVAELGFLLQATGATASESGSMTYSNLKEGDSIDVLGAKVTVKAIDVEVGPCTSTTGAGSVTGIEGIACTINANVANLGERQNIPTDLVIMDKAATNVETVIAVGGPMVNDVTAALFPAENPLQGAGDVYIAEVAAGKIVVAGYTADDTMDAAMNFIATLRGQ